jgi:hypothetical protein
MILREIHCDRCEAVEKEKIENTGWNGWGAISGLKFEESSREAAYLCPKCMQELIDNFLNKDGE